MHTMNFNVDKGIEILERIPRIIESMVVGLSDEWLTHNEGGESWSPFDVVGHMVHGEKTDWVDRITIIMSNGDNKTFAPFDRFAQFRDSQGKTIEDLCHELSTLRAKNIDFLRSLNIAETDLDKTGIHPALGEVTLRNLLACWVAHDLGHVGQIARVMAKQFKADVGPWVEFLRILQS